MANINLPIVKRFSGHKNPGDFAERYFRQNYFKGIGLKFRKIRKDKKGKKPDGFVLDKKQNMIALAEIKLIEYKNRGNEFQRINTDDTVRNSILGAKKQLKAMNIDLPRIIYLIRDDTFLNPEALRQAIFGKQEMIVQGGEIVFNYYSGFNYKTRKNNKMMSNTISGIICYVPMMNEYKLWVYINKQAKPVPNELLDSKHVEELWDFDGICLKKSR